MLQPHQVLVLSLGREAAAHEVGADRLHPRQVAAHLGHDDHKRDGAGRALAQHADVAKARVHRGVVEGRVGLEGAALWAEALEGPLRAEELVGVAKRRAEVAWAEAVVAVERRGVALVLHAQDAAQRALHLARQRRLIRRLVLGERLVPRRHHEHPRQQQLRRVAETQVGRLERLVVLPPQPHLVHLAAAVAARRRAVAAAALAAAAAAILLVPRPSQHDLLGVACAVHLGPPVAPRDKLDAEGRVAQLDAPPLDTRAPL